MSDPRSALWIAVPVGFSALVGAVFMTRWPLVMAELWTITESYAPLGVLLDHVAADNHPPLYFLLTWLLARVTDTHVLFRLPSVVAAVAAVAVVAVWGRRLQGPMVALVAALVLAAHPYFVAYGVEARSVSLTVLLAVCMYFATMEVMDSDRPRAWALALALLTAVGLYVHYDMSGAAACCGAGLVAGSASAARPLSERRHRLLLGLGALLAAGLAFVPWALGVMIDQRALHTAAPRSWAFVEVFLWPVGFGRHVVAGTGVLLLLATVGLFVVLRRGGPKGWMLAGALPMAFLVPYVWSSNPQVITKTYLFAPFLPLWALLVGHGASRVWEMATARWQRARPFGWVLALALACLPLNSLRLMFTLHNSPVDYSCENCVAFDSVADLEVFRIAGLDRWPGHDPRMPHSDFLYAWSQDGPPLWFTSRAEYGSTAWRITRPFEARFLGPITIPGREVLRNFTGVFYWDLALAEPKLCFEVLQALRVAWDADGHAPYGLALADDEWRMGNVDLALALGAAAQDSDPLWYPPSVFQARVLESEGRASEAADVLASGIRRASRWAPPSLDTLQLQARLYALAEDPDGLAAVNARIDCLLATDIGWLCDTPLRELFRRDPPAQQTEGPVSRPL